MLRVYNYMAAGIALTGVVAYVIFTYSVTTDPRSARSAAVPSAARGMYLTPFGQTIFATPLKWVVMLAPLAFVFFLSLRIYKMSVGAAQIAFWLFAAVMGVSLSSIFLVYTGHVDHAGVLRDGSGLRRRSASTATRPRRISPVGVRS